MSKGVRRLVCGCNPVGENVRIIEEIKCQSENLRVKESLSTAWTELHLRALDTVFAHKTVFYDKHYAADILTAFCGVLLLNDTLGINCAHAQDPPPH